MVAAEQARQLQMAQAAQARLAPQHRVVAAAGGGHRRRRHRRSRRRQTRSSRRPRRTAGAVGVAMSQLGTPYVWARRAARRLRLLGPRRRGRSRRSASRCRTRRMRSTAWASPVSRDQLQPGDLVFFDGLGHVGHLHRRRPVRARTAHRRRREDLQPRRGLVRLDLRRRPPHPLALRRDQSLEAVDVGREVVETTLRLSFSVGVISSCSSVNSRGRIVKRLICSKRERSAFTASTARLHLGVDVGRRSATSGIERDQRRDVRLAVADDERLRDDSMRLQLVLEVLRRDVLAAGGDDDVLLAVGDHEEAVVVEVADVAGVHEAFVVEHLARSPRGRGSSRRRPCSSGAGSRRPRRSGPRRRGAACRPCRT